MRRESLILQSNMYYCPICSSILQPRGPVYTIDQIFELWKPIIFTIKTIEDHRAQSPFTQMYSCSKCELDIFLPQIIGTPQFYIEAYSLNSEKTTDKFTYSEDKWEFHEAIHDLKENQSILEIGCGDGSFLKKIHSRYPIVVGLEYNENAINTARNRGLCVFGLWEIDDIKKESFDIVLSFHVIEHVDDPIEFIKQMMDYVKPGGKIIFSVPNQDGPIKYIDPCIHNMPPHHASRLHKKTIETFAQILNLEIEKIAYEPLLLQNSSYYSFYWINHILTSEKKWIHYLKISFSIILELFFKTLQKIGLKYFPILRGQSIYVIMRKESTLKVLINEYLQ